MGGEKMEIIVTVVGTVITVLAIVLAWKSDRRIQENMGKMLKEIAAGQKELGQMLLNQTKILERIEARMSST
jgi:F420-dependent methylenetetrahydromethanopterin dehydrogenase